MESLTVDHVIYPHLIPTFRWHI